MENEQFAWNFRGRRTMRFQDRDYSLPGDYFVTICAKDRRCLFGEIQDRVMRINGLGRIIEREWLETAIIRPNISLGPWVIMPNHLHMIITIRGLDDPHYVTTGAHDECPNVMSPVGATRRNVRSLVGAHCVRPEQANDEVFTMNVRGARSAPLPRKPNSLSSLIAGFKSKTTSEYRKRFGEHVSFWQRNYWESIINDERQYEAVAEYIINNPRNWNKDEFNPDTHGGAKLGNV